MTATEVYDKFFEDEEYELANAPADTYSYRSGWNTALKRVSIIIRGEIRPTGKWEQVGTSSCGDKKECASFQCSECGRSIVYVHVDGNDQSFEEGLAEFLEKYPYCHCGTKMNVSILSLWSQMEVSENGNSK